MRIVTLFRWLYRWKSDTQGHGTHSIVYLFEQVLFIFDDYILKNNLVFLFCLRADIVMLNIFVDNIMETAPFLFERPINTRAQNHIKLPVSYAIVNEIERQVTAEG